MQGSTWRPGLWRKDPWPKSDPTEKFGPDFSKHMAFFRIAVDKNGETSPNAVTPRGGGGFSLGREDIIPKMFHRLVENLHDGAPVRWARFHDQARTIGTYLFDITYVFSIMGLNIV